MEGAGEERLHGADDERGGADQVDLHHQRGQVGEILRVAHRGLRHHHGDQDAAGPADALGHVDHVQRHHQADGQADEQQGQARVQLGHVAQRHREALRHLLPRAVAGVRPRPRRRRPRPDDDGEQRQQPVVETDEETGHQQAGRPGAVVAPVPVDEHDGVDQQEHGGEEVHHDHVGVELGVDDDAAQHRLGQDAGHQPAAQPDQVAPAGRAQDGAQEGGRHREHQHDGHEAVAELDQAVELEGRGEVARRAFGPVRAAQARSGEPHGPPGDHDEGGQDQGDHVEPVAERGRDGGGTAPRHDGPSVPGPAAWSRARPGPTLGKP